MEKNTSSVCIRYDILSNFNTDIQDKNRDPNFASKIVWSIGLEKDPNTIVSFIKPRREFDLLLAGSILKADKFEAEYKNTSALLPYGLIINGLIIAAETVMEEKMLSSTSTRIDKSIKKFKNHNLPDTYFFTFVRKMPTDYYLWTGADVMTFKITNTDIKRVGARYEGPDRDLFSYSKNYFALSTNFYKPQNHRDYEPALSLPGTDIVVIGQNAKFDENQAKKFLESQESLVIPCEPGMSILTRIPLSRVDIRLAPSYKHEKPDDNELVTDVNQYEILGYFRFDSDFKVDLKGFAKHISDTIKHVEELQKDEIYMGVDLAYESFIDRLYGLGYSIVMPQQRKRRIEFLDFFYEKYSLPKRPIMRPEDTVSAIEEWWSGHKTDKLTNVHYKLPYEPFSGGFQFMNDGTYEYYHLDKDGQDYGWGHTYRALQIVLSWYKYERQLKEIPSIKEIQNILVKAGEKKEDFEGSNDTIGAYEVGVVLQKLIDVESKVLYIGNGKLVPEQARELKNHFIREKAPILIGGGCRAFVILGIDYNENTNEVRFLVLNPHFKGTETLEELQKDGWVSWKDSTFFLKDAFYNFCLPCAKLLQSPKKLKKRATVIF